MFPDPMALSPPGAKEETFLLGVQFPQALYHERCRLQRLEGFSLEQQMFALASESRVSEFLEWDCHQSLEDTRVFLEYVRLQQDQGRGVYYAVLIGEYLAGVVSAEARGAVPALDEAVLSTGNLICEDRLHTIEISTWLGRNFWGKGLGVLAKSLLLSVVRQSKKPIVAYSRIATDNLRAKKAIQKLQNGAHLRCSHPLVVGGQAIETVVALLRIEELQQTADTLQTNSKPQKFPQSEWDVLLACPYSPALVYSLAACERNFKKLQASLLTIGGDASDIFFALKSCYVGPVMETYKELGGGVEVMSDLELSLALNKGFKGKQILCNGLNKSVKYLWRAIEVDALVVIDVAQEVMLLSQLAKRLGRSVRVGVRISVDLPVNTEGAYGAGASKLGFELNEKLLDDVLSWIARDSLLTLELLHAHTAQNARSSVAHEHGLLRLRQALDMLEAKGWAGALTTIDIGGGWAADEPFSNLSADAQKLDLLRKARDLFPLFRIVVEPGRLLVHNAGFVVATVVATKRKKNRTFVVQDAGTNSLIPLPSNEYTILYPPPVAPLHSPSTPPLLCDFVDGITSPSNVIAQNTGLERVPLPGEKVIIGNCGAYTSVLAEFWASEPIPLYISADGNIRNFLSQESLVAARSILLEPGECSDD